jgi:hypothetical protein
MLCVQCGADSPNGANFCMKCGASLVSQLDKAALAARFTEAMLRIYGEADRKYNYRPRRFHEMVETHGGVETAKRLLRGGEQSGLDRLWRCGALGLSMEALVGRPEWRVLFSEQERATARQRLADRGYFLDD